MSHAEWRQRSKTKGNVKFNTAKMILSDSYRHTEDKQETE